MGKQLGKLGSLTLLGQPVKEKENSEFKLVVFCLKTDLVSHPACGGGVEWIYTYSTLICFLKYTF